MALIIVGDIKSLISVETWSKNIKKNKICCESSTFKLFSLQLRSEVHVFQNRLLGELFGSLQALTLNQGQVLRNGGWWVESRCGVAGGCASVVCFRCASFTLGVPLGILIGAEEADTPRWKSVRKTFYNLILQFFCEIGRNWGRAKQQSREGWAKSRSPPGTSVGRAEGGRFLDLWWFHHDIMCKTQAAYSSYTVSMFNTDFEIPPPAAGQSGDDTRHTSKPRKMITSKRSNPTKFDLSNSDISNCRSNSLRA